MCWMAVQMPLQRWLAAASDTRAQKMDVSQAKKLVGAKAVRAWFSSWEALQHSVVDPVRRLEAELALRGTSFRAASKKWL